MLKTYSVIIPTLNEEANLSKCIHSVRMASTTDVEIIVVDGKSGDHTRSVAKESGVKVIETKKGRGHQLSAGAKMASGSILVFLHADTLLPVDAFKVLEEYFQSDSKQLCAFRLKFDHNHWALNFYSFMSRVESLWTTFGDQCIVVRSSFYSSIGGFKDWPLFEDIDFLRNARKVTNIGKLERSVITSADKFLTNGMVRQQIKNGTLICRYLLGKDPHQLAQHYYSSAVE